MKRALNIGLAVMLAVVVAAPWAAAARPVAINDGGGGTSTPEMCGALSEYSDEGHLMIQARVYADCIHAAYTWAPSEDLFYLTKLVDGHWTAVSFRLGSTVATAWSDSRGYREEITLPLDAVPYEMGGSGGPNMAPLRVIHDAFGMAGTVEAESVPARHLTVHPPVSGHCQGPGNWGFSLWDWDTWSVCDDIDWTIPFPETVTIFGPDLIWNLQDAGASDQISYLNSTVAMHEGELPRTTAEALAETMDQVAQDILTAEAIAAFALFGRDLAAYYSTPGGVIQNAGKAVIDPRKLTHYALDPNNPRGAAKARVFQSALGYNQGNYKDLMAKIRRGVTRYPGLLGDLDQYGQRYNVFIPVTGPNGNTATVLTAWIYEPGSSVPRLLTLYVK